MDLKEAADAFCKLGRINEFEYTQDADGAFSVKAYEMSGFPCLHYKFSRSGSIRSHEDSLASAADVGSDDSNVISDANEEDDDDPFSDRDHPNRGTGIADSHSDAPAGTSGESQIVLESDSSRYVCSETGFIVQTDNALRRVSVKPSPLQFRKRRRRSLSDSEDAVQSQCVHQNALRIAARELTTEGQSTIQFLRSVCPYCDREFPVEGELLVHKETCCLSRKTLLTTRAATLARQLISVGVTRAHFATGECLVLREYASRISDSVQQKCQRQCG